MGTETSAHVVVTDIRMPSWSMVVFMIKWAVAAIPAFIILAVLGGVAAALLSGFGIIIGLGR
jgi:integral membrane sensor domain MASE1